MNKSIKVIGLCGGSGSGKTTLCEELVKRHPKSVTLINQDRYYKPGLIDDSNFDHPDSVDYELLISQIVALKNGQSVPVPLYDFESHSRQVVTEEILSADVLLVEGVLLYCLANLTALFDLKIFIECDDDVRLIRRIKRDMDARGRSLDSILKQYEQQVKPMHKQYVDSNQHVADVIVSGIDSVELNSDRLSKLLGV